MRITAGTLRGRKVPVPDMPGVRPTPSKARQALFNILGGVDGYHVLDLFSGSGLMALESLSRGAASVVSVEKNRRITQQLTGVCRAWELEERWQIFCGDVSNSLGHLGRKQFDLVFADPPYDCGVSARLPQWLAQAGISCAELVIEESSRARPEWPAGWTQRQVRRYGGTCFYFLNAEDA